MHATNDIPLGCSLLLPVGTVNSVQTLKDVTYGHHPCSVNFYVPLTSIGGSSALHLESAPGREDWHPITGEYGEVVKHFAGGICNHWTVRCSVFGFGFGFGVGFGVGLDRVRFKTQCCTLEESDWEPRIAPLEAGAVRVTNSISLGVHVLTGWRCNLCCTAAGREQDWPHPCLA
jgi:hypothetical protein